MLKLISRPAIVGAFASLILLSATSAFALSHLTFVSGKGANVGTCASPSTPCRTFQFALNKTSPGGEIKALDPAFYGGMTITKSISISGVEGAGIDRTSSNPAITINAGPNDAINLSHLILDGLKVSSHGIVFNAGGSLTMTHCTVRNFTGAGIFFRPNSRSSFLIARLSISNNTNWGILVVPQSTGTALGTLDHVSMNQNTNGLIITGAGTSVLVVDSSATNNSQGFGVGAGAVLRLAHSSATGNLTGVRAPAGGGIAESLGDNFIASNVTDVDGNLTPVTPQ
jgi:hypothetical protein